MTSNAEMATLATIAREWGRLGVIGFGGPPAHISLLRRLCVVERGWLSASDFEDAIAATNLLPGPASTQLAMFCAWRLRGRPGALVGGLCFIVPGLVMILLLSILFLGSDPPRWVLGTAAGAGAAVPAVAASAAVALIRPSWRRAGAHPAARARWVLYLVAGGLAGATVGTVLVLVIAACGLAEIAGRSRPPIGPAGTSRASLLAIVPAGAATGGMAALAWVALKVGALSYGGGFVIIPLMQRDAVDTYQWMTASQFLNAVALGQVTPGPVVLTIAAVGYAAGGLAAGVMAAVIAFGPSLLFVMIGGPHFDRLRRNQSIQAFLTGAGAAAIGGIAGAALPLARSLSEPWQIAVLAAAATWLVVRPRHVVPVLLLAGAVGAAVVAVGAPLPG